MATQRCTEIDGHMGILTSPPPCSAVTLKLPASLTPKTTQ